MRNAPHTPYIIDLLPMEEWSYQFPECGSHIRVKRMGGMYTHHGIYISQHEVIHFTGEEDDNIMDWSNNEVICTDLTRFLNGGVLEVKIYTEEEKVDLYPVEDIVSYARSCLGDKNYNLLFNNCEHFANICTLGRFRSQQVETLGKLLLPSPILGGKTTMGLFDLIGNIFGSKNKNTSNRSTSTTTTTYDPDKVKVAEIERETTLRLAGFENERIHLAKNAQLELMEKQLYCQEALIEAHARGLSHTAQVLIKVGEDLNELTRQRLEIIEAGSMQLIQQYEDFYAQLNHNISEEYYTFIELKLPALLSTLEKFEEGSSSHQMYQKNLDHLSSFQLSSMLEQRAGLKERQHDVQKSLLSFKEMLIEQSATASAQLLEHMQQQQLSLGLDADSRRQLLESPPVPSLMPSTDSI